MIGPRKLSPSTPVQADEKLLGEIRNGLGSRRGIGGRANRMRRRRSPEWTLYARAAITVDFARVSYSRHRRTRISTLEFRIWSAAGCRRARRLLASRGSSTGGDEKREPSTRHRVP